MTLSSTIDQDLGTAMKAGENQRVTTLRLLKNALKNEQIKLGRELSEDEARKVLQRESKQRRDSIEQYRSGGRQDLVAAEQQELEIIERYLPEQMSADELATLVDKVIAETGATDKSQMGTVIGAVVQQAQGRADGAAIAQLVRQKLA